VTAGKHPFSEMGRQIDCCLRGGALISGWESNCGGRNVGFAGGFCGFWLWIEEEQDFLSHLCHHSEMTVGAPSLGCTG
jgi:hypothetical protein